MTKIVTTSVTALTLALLLTSGCKKNTQQSEGPMESAGEEVDQAGESAAERTEEAGEKAEEKMEQTGDKVEDATD